MNTLIEKYVSKAMSYVQYNFLFKQLVEAKMTTGEQTQEKIDYTKLNYSRSKRLDKTAEIIVKRKGIFQKISERQTWLVISEPWCGDAAQILPILNKLSQLSDNIDLKIVLRDENPELMDAFLTNGSRSIPKLIMLDENFNVIQTWGPRSKNATKLVQDYKDEHGKIDATLKEMLQIWYNNDKGASTVNDLSEMIVSSKVM